MTLIRNYIISLVILVASSFTLLGAPVFAASDTQKNICGGAELQLNAADCDKSTTGSTSTIENLIRDIVNILSIIVGIVAVIMIIYGGFRYVTSSGDSGNITTAKNIIVYSIIGLIIAALAQVIVKFVLSKTVT